MRGQSTRKVLAKPNECSKAPVGYAAIGNPHLLSVDDPLVAFLHGVRFYARHITADACLGGAVGLSNAHMSR